MRVRENPAYVSELLQRIGRKMVEERVPGIHVSDLLYCLPKSYWRKRLGTPDVVDEEATLVFLLGKGLHFLFEEGRPEVSRLTDAIIASPDKFEVDDISPIVIEFKTTRASSNKSILESKHYFDQLGAYCYVAGVRRGRLVVAYYSGNYKPPKPEMKAWDVTFSKRELELWWEELRRRKLILEEAVAYDRPPDVWLHYPWTCKYCEFHKRECPGGEGEWQGFFNLTDTMPFDL